MPASGAGLRVERGGSDQFSSEGDIYIPPCERAASLCAGGTRGGEMAKTISSLFRLTESGASQCDRIGIVLDGLSTGSPLQVHLKQPFQNVQIRRVT